jgi:hypothetical protein
MLSQEPLFTFELEVIYAFGFFWLVEYCVFWNGSRNIVEMVKLEGNINGYVEEI